jgi:uncharacterized membrane protein
MSQAVLYLFNSATTHFSRHQFGVATKGGYEVVIHNIRCTLYQIVLQLDVTNVFNSMLKRVVFQELRAIGGDILQPIPFVRALYAFEFPLIYNHDNREGDITIIPSTMGTHQSDPWGGAQYSF